VEKLTGKVAVITGGGGGIGGAVAMDMAAEGARIVVNDFGKDENGKNYADIMMEKIQKAGGTAVVDYNDISAIAGGANLIQTAIENYGRVDILLNTAGFSRRGPAVDMSEEDWDSVIAVHLKGHFSCSQAAAKEMIKQNDGGRIINVSSVAGFGFMDVPFFGISYATAKAGVVGFTGKLCGELSKYGITVNAIFPNAVTRGFPEERPGADTPDHMAPLIVYLATDEAKDITGQLFHIGPGEVGLFPRPIQQQSVLVRKIGGKWTVDELSQAVPQMMPRLGPPPGGPGGPPR
jgi:NAD(P)-dependent dehydrogenase (short-subunit alcohol dehydrogenase family)